MKKLLMAFAWLGLLCTGANGQTVWVQNAHVITYVPHNPCAGVPITFGLHDTTGVYQNAMHFWYFGDGGSAWTNNYMPSPSHAYAAAGNYQLTVVTWDSSTAVSDSSVVMIHVDSVCGSMDNVTGKLYQDVNGNGTQEPGELPWPNRMVRIDPGAFYVTTDLSGNYGVNLNAGTYTLTAPAPLYQTLTSPVSGSHVVTTTGSNGTVGGNDFAFTPISTAINDLELSGWVLPQVPGFTRVFSYTYENVGTTVLSPTVTLSFPGVMTVVSIHNGGTQVGNTVNWTLPATPPGSWGTVACSLMVPVGTPLGTALNFVATIDPVTGDTTPGNNVVNVTKVVVGSWDPNAKEVAPAGNGPAGEVAPGTPLTYTVHFQNTGNFPATNVVLQDTLDGDLDVTTLEVLGGSHPFHWFLEADRLTFDFPNIMLPDSNSNEPASHGHVVYRIQHKSSAGIGTEITNTASIYFDFNAPVVTNTTLTTLANPVSVAGPDRGVELVVWPNPSEGWTRIAFANAGPAACSLLLYDGSGKLVKVVDGLMGEDYLLDASGLPAGLYTVRLAGGDGRSEVVKLVKL